VLFIPRRLKFLPDGYHPPHGYHRRDMPPLDAMLEHRIRQRAYQIYQARLDNAALYDWLQAEREILAEMRHFEGSQPESEMGSAKSEMPPQK
jgi:hypothetical protein